MVAAEQNEQRTNCRWEKEQPIFSKCIWMQFPSSISYSDFVLILLIVPVQRSQVNV